jgi:hypothetical protein
MLFFTQLAIGIWIVAVSLMLFLRWGGDDTWHAARLDQSTSSVSGSKK